MASASGHLAFGLYTTQQPSPETLSMQARIPLADVIFPKGIQPIAGGRAQRKPPDCGLPTPVYPEGIAAFASRNWPERLESLRDTEAFVTRTGGVAALDHRLWAVTPPGWGVLLTPMARVRG